MVRRTRRRLAAFLALGALLCPAGVQIWACVLVDRFADRLAERRTETLEWHPSTALLNATVAMEDRNFYLHSGFDWRAMSSALRGNLRAGRILSGGSTISQQLAKNLFLSNDRSLLRKVLEVPLTIALERRFSKPQILDIYTHVVPYGLRLVGADEAALHYFHAHADELDIGQAALLVGIVPHNPRTMPSEEELAAWRKVALARIGALYRDEYGEDALIRASLRPVDRVVYPYRIDRIKVRPL